jgi:hypothetical protein
MRYAFYLLCCGMITGGVTTIQAADNTSTATTTTTTTNSTNATGSTQTHTVKIKKKRHRTVADRGVASNNNDTAVVTASIPRENSTLFTVSASPGLTVAGGAAAFTFDFGATVKPLRDYPLHVGADLGVDLYGGATGFHFLPTAYWVFEINNAPTTRFTAGLSIGPTITSTGGVTVANGLGSTAVIGGPTNVYFELLLKPGVEFDLAKSFMLRINPNFGLIGANFAFVPQVSGIYTF